jgi:hypothetical protein
MKSYDKEIGGHTLRIEYTTVMSYIQDSVERIGVTKKCDYDELKNMDASEWITLTSVTIIQPKDVMPLTLSPNILAIVDEGILELIRDEIKQIELQKL